VKGWKMIYPANGSQNQEGVAILILDKPTLIKWDKEGYSIQTKGAIHNKEITIINL
jgi:hypothetical protein